MTSVLVPSAGWRLMRANLLKSLLKKILKIQRKDGLFSSSEHCYVHIWYLELLNLPAAWGRTAKAVEQELGHTGAKKFALLWLPVMKISIPLLFKPAKTRVSLPFSLKHPNWYNSTTSEVPHKHALGRNICSWPEKVSKENEWNLNKNDDYLRSCLCGSSPVYPSSQVLCQSDWCSGIQNRTSVESTQWVNFLL